jgi:hypothetical protein
MPAAVMGDPPLDSIVAPSAAVDVVTVMEAGLSITGCVAGEPVQMEPEAAMIFDPSDDEANDCQC